MNDFHLTNCVDLGELKIENTNIKTAPGVSLDEHGKTLVGSVLDVSTEDRTLSILQVPNKISCSRVAHR